METLMVATLIKRNDFKDKAACKKNPAKKLQDFFC